MIRISGLRKTMKMLSSKHKLEEERLKRAELNKLVKELEEATPVDTGRARDGWEVEGDAIVNDVPYISDLNNGSSQQAPPFFIEQTVLAHKGVRPRGIIVRNK